MENRRGANFRHRSLGRELCDRRRFRRRATTLKPPHDAGPVPGVPADVAACLLRKGETVPLDDAATTVGSRTDEAA